MLVRNKPSRQGGEDPKQPLIQESGASSANLGPTQEKYSDQSALVQFTNRSFFRALQDMLRRLEIHSSLDAGCGEGEIISRLNTPSIVGLDLDRERTRVARLRLPSALLAVSDIHSIPFPSNSFDLVLVLEVFEHVGNPIAVLQEVARVSRNYLLASVPNEPWWRLGNMMRLKYLRDFGNTPEHLHHWSSSGFRRFISNSFEVIQFKKPFLWTFVLAKKATPESH